METSTDLRLTIVNTSPAGGTFLTPVYFGFHDGGFDLFEVGEAASPGLESLAEDGSPAILATERLAASPESQGAVVAGEAGPVATEETTSAIVSVDGATNGYVSLAAMVIPSNDAFIGTDEAVRLFAGNGAFLGETTLVFEGADVYDAGTEVNTELDAAFINQTAPNTGLDENGVVAPHPGFNGSAGNPAGDGDQIILGGTNAAGQPIDPVAADFTLPGAQIAVVHINTVVEHEASDGNDRIVGRRDDDIVEAGAGNDRVQGGRGWDVIDGGEGNDRLDGGRGWDAIDGGEGNDVIDGGRDDDTIAGGGGNDELDGGRGNDVIEGGDGNDEIDGGRDDDRIDGGEGNDEIDGGRGNDLILGGAGNDELEGGRGEDTFFFAAGDGDDEIADFSEEDALWLDVEGVADFDGLLALAEETGGGTLFDFGVDGSVFLERTDLDDLEAGQFHFL